MSSLKIKIQLKSEVETRELTWIVEKDPVALLWFKLLGKELKAKKSLFIRYCGLSHSRSNLKYFIASFNFLRPILKEDFQVDYPELELKLLTRNELNELHHIFEGNYGTIGNEKDTFKNASKKGQNALCALNHLVHDYETWTNRENGESETFTLPAEFENPTRLPIPEFFAPKFKLNIIPGSLVLHYGQVGKQWHEVFIDQDDVIPEEAILPLTNVSGEFDIFCSHYVLDPNLQEGFTKFLEEQGHSGSFENLNLGVLPLAIPETKMKLGEWEEILSKSSVSGISLIQDDEVLIQSFEVSEFESPFSKFLKLPTFI